MAPLLVRVIETTRLWETWEAGCHPINAKAPHERIHGSAPQSVTREEQPGTKDVSFLYGFRQAPICPPTVLQRTDIMANVY